MNPWFRMYSEFATDPKVQMLSEVDQRRFVMLLCLRCSNGDVTLQDDEVTFQLRITSEEWAASKARFLAKNLISEDNGIPNWNNHDAILRPPANMWRELREIVFCRDDFTCSYCGVRGTSLECDHIVPVSRGGSNDLDNLTTACKPCNRSKRNKLLSEWAQ